MNEPAGVTMKRKAGKAWKFWKWLTTPEPTLAQMLRDFPRFKCRECGRTMCRMENSPCFACVSRHVKEVDAMVEKLTGN